MQKFAVVAFVGAVTSMGCQEPLLDRGACAVVVESDLEALAAQEEVDCVVEVVGTDLTSLNGIAGLRRVSGFILTDNVDLRDVSALAALEPLRVLSVQRTPLASETDVSTVDGDVYLTSTDVTQLTGTQAIGAVFSFEENPTLQTFSFPNLTSLDTLGIEDNPSVSGLLDAFPALISVGIFSVRNAPLLSTAEIEALAAQAGVVAQHCGNADDDPCPALEELEEL